MLLPDRFTNFLCDSLVIPAAGASEVPLRMIASKLIQNSIPFKSVSNLKTMVKYHGRVNIGILGVSFQGP